MNPQAKAVLAPLATLSFAAASLLVIRSVIFGSLTFWYLDWNLFLAWLPLVFAWLLVRYVRHNPWVSWQGGALSLLWLGFLPNSFYIVTDFMHLQEVSQQTLLFDVVLMFMFSLAGYAVGFVSVIMVHRLLLTRINRASAARVVAGVFLACSFAIYLGRFLRWNTWDVIVNPAGIILDITDRIINPVAHEQTFWVTILFFVLLNALYFVLWQLTQSSTAVCHRKKLAE